MVRRGFAAFVLVAAAALALAPAGSATTKTALSLTSFNDLVVDDAHGHVFVTGGSGSSSIVVLDFSGNVVETIADEPGAAGMAVDAAGARLYVALRDSNAIAVIDTGTLDEVDRLSIAPAAAPSYLALAGGRVWFAHDCNSTTSRFGSIASNGTDVRLYERGNGYPLQCPILTVDPSDDDVLVASGVGTSGPTVFVYDASTAVPTLTLSKQMGDSDDFEDMLVTPDGATLLAAAGAPYVVQKFQMSDLSATGSYPTGAYPVAAAVTPDGAYVATGVDTVSGKEVVVFPAGSTTALRGFEFGITTGTQIYEASLAFSGDSSKLFSVAHPGPTGGVIFRVHGSPTTPPLPTTTTLTVSKSVVTIGGSVTLTARVKGAAGGTMSVYATPYIGPRRLIATGTVKAGVFTKKVKPAGKTTYDVEYAGDDDHLDSASTHRVVKVRVRTSVALTGFYRKSGKYRLYHRGHNPGVKGSVNPNHAGLKLKFVAQVLRNGRWKAGTVSAFTIHQNGAVPATLYRTTIGRYRARAVFPGDGDHLGSASAWVYIQVTN